MRLLVKSSREVKVTTSITGQIESRRVGISMHITYQSWNNVREPLCVVLLVLVDKRWTGMYASNSPIDTHFSVRGTHNTNIA